MTAGDLSWPLAHAVRRHAGAPAVSHAGRDLTYAELGRRAGALGPGLETLGLGAGGRVGVLAANSLAHLECVLGVPAAGRVLVDLNFRLALPELSVLVDAARVAVLMVDADRLAVGRALRDGRPDLHSLVFDGADACPPDCVPYESLVAGDPAPPHPSETDDLAVISFTGGTTGRPKGVMLSHGNLLANARHNLIATGHAHDQHWLHVCPMFHVAGTANVLAATWAGARQTVLERFDAARVADVIDATGITHTTLVPTMLGQLLDHEEAVPHDLGSLRHVQYAASPIDPGLQRRLLDRLRCDVAQFYGMTEAAPTVSHCTPEDHRRGHAGEAPFAARLGSMGAAVPGVQLGVFGPDERELPAGEIGEVRVRGPNVMLGYLDQPGETAAAFADDGWYRTGDAAYADADGYLFLVDRLKDMIVSGGENVYSVEVERVLAGHPAVLEAAVFGVPDVRWGEAVHAVVNVGAAVVEPDALTAYCRTRIAGFKIPRAIEVRTEPLPRSGAGKLLKHELRAPHWAGRERLVS